MFKPPAKQYMRKRIIIISIAFCASFITLLVLSLVSMNRFVQYVDYSNITDTSGMIIDNIYQAEVHMRDIDRNERGYMLTGDTLYRQYVLRNIDSLNGDLTDLELMIDNNSDLQKKLDILKDTIALKLAMTNENLRFIDSAKQPGVGRFFLKSRDFMRGCNRQLKQLYTAQNKKLKEQQNGEHTYEALTTHTLGYLILIFCFVTVVLFSVMIRELTIRVKFQEKLQIKLHELKRSHIELEEIAYAASHDLQEPMRKIQVFSNMLLSKETLPTDTDARETLQRINASANKMQLLVSDLLSLTSLTRIDQSKSDVDLNRTLQYLIFDLADRIKDAKAVIHYDKLPEIKGYQQQVSLLFNALLDNALKFSKEGVPPDVSITSEVTDGRDLVEFNANLKNRKFYLVRVKDNGRGFDNQFRSKLFGLFQQLDSSEPDEFRSRGIGLAICQRIMANHEGYITAEGVAGEGASFNLFFPVVTNGQFWN